jgi:hypothetical protein
MPLTPLLHAPLQAELAGALTGMGAEALGGLGGQGGAATAAPLLPAAEEYGCGLHLPDDELMLSGVCAGSAPCPMQPAQEGGAPPAHAHAWPAMLLSAWCCTCRPAVCTPD